MTIYEQIKVFLHTKTNEIITASELKNQLKNKFGTKPESIILSDYCYNRYNKGISFDKHLFQYINRNTYKYLGKNYPYTGLIFRKPKGFENEVVVGEWKNGVKIMFDEPLSNGNSSDKIEAISSDQIVKLYEDYHQILRYEMSLLKCKPTELRHLIGRIGEFICAIHTNGHLSKQPNQHGFDVISEGRRISVKTTAQPSGFITVNQNTFKDFDDFFVVQYVNDEFNVIYYGAKEDIPSIARSYDNKYEVEISRLKGL